MLGVNMMSAARSGIPRGPKSIPNLALWLDATNEESLTLVSGRASQWNDLSGNGNHAAQGTSGNRPLLVSNAMKGNKALQFFDDATAKFMSVPDAASLDYTAFSIYCAFRRVSDQGATERLVGKFSVTSPANTREFSANMNGGVDQFQVATSSVGSAADGLGNTGVTLALNTNYVGGGVFTNSSGTARVNNLAGSQATGSIPGLFAGTSPIHIGSRDGGSEPYAGYIGEVLFYTRALSNAESDFVYDYLMAKWV